MPEERKNKMSRKDTLEAIGEKRKEIEDLERELKELPERVDTVDVYLHSNKESIYEQGAQAGLSDKQLKYFVYACTEVKATLSVDENGKVEIIAVEGMTLQKKEE